MESVSANFWDDQQAAQKKMQELSALQQLADIGTFLGAIVVAISVLYVAELYARGLADYSSLVPAERVQFNMVASSYVWTAWYFYQMNRAEGLVEDLNNRVYADMFRHPGFREWFATYLPTVGGEYGDFLSKVVENAGDSDFRPGDNSNLLQGRLDFGAGPP